jgi:hypothetical protein
MVDNRDWLRSSLFFEDLAHSSLRDLAERSLALAHLRHTADSLHRQRLRFYFQVSRTGCRRSQDTSRLSIPGKPQGRDRIERFFAQLTKSFSAIWPATLSADTANRVSLWDNSTNCSVRFYFRSIKFRRTTATFRAVGGGWLSTPDA